MGKKITTTDIISSPYKGVDIEVRNKLLSSFALDLATLLPEEYITYRNVLDLIGQTPSGGAQKISIPTEGNPDYPEATLTEDGFSYTIQFGETISQLLGGFEPQLSLIKNGTQVVLGAVYFQFTGQVVTAAILEGMYSPDDVNVKVNFLA